MDSANAASAASQSKPSSLGQRVASAAVLLPLVVLLVWWSYWAVAVVVLSLIVVGLIELYGVFAHGGYRPRTALGIGMALLLGVAVVTRHVFPTAFDPLGLALTISVVAGLVVELFRPSEEHALASWGVTMGGALYVGWLFSHYMLLRDLGTTYVSGPLATLHIEQGAAWIYFVLAITWLQDTAAYFAGRAFGRTKLAPSLSPKKTWEGAIGGTLASIFAAILCVWLLNLPVSFASGALLGFVGAIAGPLGDLAESAMKRRVGVKDASTLIPGHGGLLDRADSLLFTGPVLYYLIVLLIHR